MDRKIPLWRSMLFVPVNVDRFVNSAARRGADACILDLEDSIPGDEKSEVMSQFDLSTLKVLAGVKAYPARIKCATLAWYTARSALSKGGVSVTTET